MNYFIYKGKWIEVSEHEYINHEEFNMTLTNETAYMFYKDRLIDSCSILNLTEAWLRNTMLNSLMR